MTIYKRILPAWLADFLTSSELTKKLTPKQIETVGNSYRRFIGLGKDATFAKDAFTETNTQRNTGIDTLFKSKGPSDANIFDKINNSSGTPESIQGAKNLKNKILTALKPSVNYSDAQKKYTESIAVFPDLVKKIPHGGFGAEDLISTYNRYVNKARNAILDQYNIDKQELTSLFEKDDFKTELMTTFNLSNDDINLQETINHFKENMLQDLALLKDNQLKDFDKATSESQNKLHKASATEFGVLQTLSDANEANRAMIRALGEEQRKKLQLPALSQSGVNTNINVFYDEEKAIISLVNVKDLKEWVSPAKTKMTQENGVITFQFSMINPFYYQSFKDKPLADMMLVAQTIRAQGYDTITWTISIKDSKTFENRIKQAVDASVQAGISLDKIHIKDGSGKELKLEEIFKNDPATFQRIQQKNAEVQKEIDDLEKSRSPFISAPENQKKVKKAIADAIASHKAIAAAPAEAHAELNQENNDNGPQFG